MPSMPSIRNPFRKATQVTPTLQFTRSTESFASSSTTTTTEHLKTSAKSSDIYAGSILGRPYSPLSLSTSFDSKGSESPTGTEGKALSIIRGKEDEFAGEYKLSVVNDSGVYLPPSPTEKKSFWKRNGGKSDSPIDRTSMDEPFTIPRESCEGYRRSFDISARSPIIDPSRPSLQLDGRSTRPSFERLTKLSPPVRIEECTVRGDSFEEVKLDDNKPKKWGIFARFGGDSAATTPSGRFTSAFKKETPAESIQESELKKFSTPEKQGIQLAA
ncbi:hypothetical protein L211DRAFT_834599 [Terfezia boudieri ATCC MYA-4762]|uniref:Pal1-domain-containing protein n=1 Tax=Terfezia boudieri ATCC MYA-4762 TaxID=1051890 RepID=A0A3N4LZ24_9PEZI|nr:hypothetical protein L211DRAFT_834599 [Terfezia boudieri ATCC MYA-4762]